MPVSFTVATHPPKPVAFPKGMDNGLTGKDLLSKACWERNTKPAKMRQFSLAGEHVDTKIPQIIPRNNGFVCTVVSAYNEHHNLVIRPDDVWLAILSQFHFFINANAELFRASFVSHEGRRDLTIEDTGIEGDFGAMARRMAALVDENVVDPALRSWALRAFTTTTKTDTTVGAVLLMATLKHYYHPGFCMTGCGIPRVTLMGERADWEDILGRLEKLKDYGLHSIAWYHLLHPVVVRLVAAFDIPDSTENVDFWTRAVDYKGGSGLTFYSGWINAFSAFSKTGEWLGHKLNTTVEPTAAPESLSAAEFWTTYAEQPLSVAYFPSPYRATRGAGPARLILDGTQYHRLDCNRVPPGYAEVDVTLYNDQGGKMADCAMVAGVVGMRVTSSGASGSDVAASVTGQNDTVSPVTGWWFYEKSLATV
ncbi:hypothetical protein C8R43DRAFT_905107 [Mycena crocata]|nr:hypothetical protein C8R43DRAFT_905107 [Mycena crocata]